MLPCIDAKKAAWSPSLHTTEARTLSTLALRGNQYRRPSSNATPVGRCEMREPGAADRKEPQAAVVADGDADREEVPLLCKAYAAEVKDPQRGVGAKRSAKRCVARAGGAAVVRALEVRPIILPQWFCTVPEQLRSSAPTRVSKNRQTP